MSMSKRWVGMILTLHISLQPAAVVLAQSATSAQPEVRASDTLSADYLCPPRVQLRHPEVCPHVGPASDLEQLARLGMYPMKPMPTVEPELGPPYLDFVYLRMTREGTPLYATPEDAFAGAGVSQVSPRGLVYYSYYNQYTGPSQEIVYRTGFGYVRDTDVEKATIAGRRGLQFSHTPDRPFGWVTS